MRSSTSRKPIAIGLGVTALTILAGAWMVAALEQPLHTTHFVTGWVAALVLGVSGLQWLRPTIGAGAQGAMQRRVRLNLWIGALLLFTFLVHVEFRLPIGAMERILTAGFLALLGSTLFGGFLLRAEGADINLTKRWLQVQISVHWSLLGVALFHGVFTHAHGLMAHFLPASPG